MVTVTRHNIVAILYGIEIPTLMLYIWNECSSSIILQLKRYADTGRKSSKW